MFSSIGSPQSSTSPYLDCSIDFAPVKPNEIPPQDLSFCSTSSIDEERNEVIIGSCIEWTPEFLQLLRAGSKKEFPDCFDGTPIKAKLPKQVLLPAQSDDQEFMKFFVGVYNEILVHMDFSDEELLAYGPSEREDLLVQINVFFANLGHVKQENYDQGYDDLLNRLYERFGVQDIFVGYFPQYNDSKG